MALATLRTRKTNYPYVVARIQAKRGKLIPRAQYDKLLKMDVSEITRFIEESEYKTDVDELSSRFGGLDLLEAALTVNEERVYASVRKMLAGEGGRVVNQFLLRYFVEDIKTILRGKAAGAGRDELLRELLLEDLDTYNVFMPLIADDISTVEDVIDALDRQGPLASSWAKVLRKVPAGSSLAAYEDVLDKAYAAQLLEVADSFSEKGATVFRDFVRMEIDARNLQNAARWVHSGVEGDFTPYVIPGGRRLKVAHVMALAEAPDLGAFEDMLSGHDMYDQLKEGLARSRDDGRLRHFALAVQQNLFVNLDRLAAASPLSIIPILTFVLRKRAEVVTLRTLARGKAAGLSEERLQEMLP